MTFHSLLTVWSSFLQSFAPRGQGCPPLACRPYQPVIELQLVTPQPQLDGLTSASCAVNSDDLPTLRGEDRDKA